ncbi:helix-turn-helix domain-containing protein [Paraburkholderia unamae]|uniref:helix-turn-helix domain-containing protein n=1 Tax=Paraburkholderia unamae TaxID=219649 RepID=UPI0021ACE122|nr:helix-turn-helix domain-containing protein [Paraburkholderia unamae]
MAAECFMEQGFHATSIDDVARRLGATKGRVAAAAANAQSIRELGERLARLKPTKKCVSVADGNCRFSLRGEYPREAVTRQHNGGGRCASWSKVRSGLSAGRSLRNCWMVSALPADKAAIARSMKSCS